MPICRTPWVLALLWASCAPASAAPAEAGRSVPTSAAVLEDAPPALRSMLQQASAFESATDTPEGAWQAAVLYCQAARWGSTEGQYRLGMLYAFGQGVPASRPFAAALFSLAASQGHAQATQMLDNIQLTSTELPACVNHDQPPEKAPAPQSLASGGSAAIDQYLLALPAHKRWLIPLTHRLSEWYALDPKLVLSVIAVESNFQTGAKSPKAAMGLMQLIPDTAERFNVRNAFDATQNLRGGMRYLRWLLSYYRGNVSYALAAYNAGEGRVNRHKGIPPFPETRAYVKRVIGLYGGTHHSFDEKLTAGAPWMAVGGR
ncbi:MAG: transglycosylase SLT domain-containing protein [Thiobacillus sp.]